MKLNIKTFLVPLLAGFTLGEASYHPDKFIGGALLFLAIVLVVSWLYWVQRKCKVLPLLLAGLLVSLTVQAQSSPPPKPQPQQNSLGIVGATIIGACVLVGGYFLYRWLRDTATRLLNPPPPDNPTNQPPDKATE